MKKSRIKLLMVVLPLILFQFAGVIPVYAYTQDELIDSIYIENNYDESQEDNTNNAKNNGSIQKEYLCEHTYRAVITREPICEMKGELTYVCTQCGSTYTEVISAENHSYILEITRIATCTEAGETTYTCTLCGVSYTEEIAMPDHVTGDWQTVEEATCVDHGIREQYCEECGVVLNSEIIEPVGHILGEWVVAIKATLFETGLEEQRCMACSELVDNMEIPIDMNSWYNIIGAGTVNVFLVLITIFFVRKRNLYLKKQ